MEIMVLIGKQLAGVSMGPIVGSLGSLGSLMVLLTLGIVRPLSGQTTEAQRPRWPTSSVNPSRLYLLSESPRTLEILT